MKKFTLFLFMCVIVSAFTHIMAQTGSIKVVVLGSSTAAGTGPEDISNAWVNRYDRYIKSLNPASEVINLAYGGYTTYEVMPADFTPPAERPLVDNNRNITKALSLGPNVIIVNLPSNDVANGFTVEEQLFNFDTIVYIAANSGIPIYLTTTQPRNMSPENMQKQMDVRDSINNMMGERAIDFWTDIANVDGTIKTIFDSGDGTHLNDSAHYVLAQRVIAEDILTHCNSSNPVDTIYLDCGSALSAGNYNNLDNAVSSSVGNMINSQGESTGISVTIHDAFTGINTGGTSSPDPSVELLSTATSDNFFGSVIEHEGIIEPTGGFTLSGLDYHSLYSFSFFASRMGVGDNREAKYKVTGMETDSVLLDASNNTTNVAVIDEIQPLVDGTITIDVSPGPSNDNSKNYYYIGAIRIVAERQEYENDTSGTINIDLGSNISTGMWNNLTKATGNQTIADLVNTEGNSTGISVWVHDAFTGINTSGTTSPEASLNFDPNASSDSFFGNEGDHEGIIEPTAGITIAGLNQTAVCDLTFFASRMGVGDNRETRYTVNGNSESVVDLDPANNTSNVVTVEDMQPNASGVITVTVSPGPNNNNSKKYYYLGIMRIDYTYSHVSAMDEISAAGRLISNVYPNPCKDYVNIDYYIPEAGNVQVVIYTLQGQVVKTVVDKYMTGGHYNTLWSIDGIGSGVYICQVKLTTKGKVYTQNQRVITLP